MASSETKLWTLVSEIEPTQAQKEGASRSHNFLRETLRTGELGNRISADYLSGSYSRDTAIRPIDDVDVIFVLRPEAWRSPQNPAQVVAPYVVLDSFATTIRSRYPVSTVVGQRRSVSLQLYHLDIDVVPAVQDHQTPEFIWIPDRTASSWIKSSPKRHSDFATQVNMRAGGRLKPLIKLMKFWNKGLPEKFRFKSFAIETMVVRVFDRVDLPSLEKGMLTMLDFMASFNGKSRVYSWHDTFGVHFTLLGGATIPDTAGTGTNVGDGIEATTQFGFLESAVVSRDLIIQAQLMTSPDSSWNLFRRALNVL